MRIEIQRLESDANGCVLRFSVQDAGPGIAAERIPELFKPFSQDGASLVRNNAGAGLGLPIAKRLAEMMGGAIGCLSQIGRGSTFWFTARFGLCADAESAPPAAPGGALAAPNRDPSHARILLVEDNETNRAILMAMLEKIGCEAEAALSGADALEALSQRPFDLVLMDVQMPGLDGIETTRAIRRRAAGSVACNVPVVALTAHAMPGDRERCLEAGMNDYLAKPVRIDDLAQTLARHCSGAGASAAAAALAETAPVRETPFAESELLRFMAGDREIACKALHMFASKTPERIAAMRQALDSRDSESLHLLAHAQKSATAYAGALPLSAIARELEAAARALEWDHAATLVEQFEKQYRIAFEAMKESPVWKSEEQT
ncbi:MAG: Aerobic respiration control sensor protein ArcB [candidate division BRC1 bacterium ADurb.BinA364]|nr:MAG: Aerobic respiration control sensor protein ArcB [candidate division BRC1 bacterium ADurb.BinA364]